MKKMFFTAVALVAMGSGTIANASNINPQSFIKIALNYKKLPQRDITAIHNFCVNVAADSLESFDPNGSLSVPQQNSFYQMSYTLCVFASL